MPKAQQQQQHKKKKKCMWAWRGWDAPDKMLKARKLYVKRVKQQEEKPTNVQDNNSAMDESD